MYALILAGGRGERLKPLTDRLPKPLAQVAGQAILEYQIAWLRDSGCRDIVVLCGYLAECIQQFLGNGSRFDVRVQYSVEDSPLGRGGAIKKGLSLVPPGENTVVALNGDVLTSIALDELVSFHRSMNSRCTAMLVPYPNQYGVVEVAENGKIRSFKEKGTLPLWINGGVYVFDRTIESQLPQNGDHETTTFPELADAGTLAGYRSDAFWTSIESLKDVRSIESDFPVALRRFRSTDRSRTEHVPAGTRRI